MTLAETAAQEVIISKCSIATHVVTGKDDA
jgi:hypothetical protein